MPKKIATFLLVDDDDNFAFFAKRAFDQDLAHLALQVVDDGLEAQRYLEGVGRFADRQKYPLPKTILLDLKMPLCSGFEFLEWRAKAAEAIRLIPVVVMTNSPLNFDILRSYNLGANAYLIKPNKWADMKKQFKALGLWADNVTPEVVVINPNRVTPPPADGQKPSE